MPVPFDNSTIANYKRSKPSVALIEYTVRFVVLGAMGGLRCSERKLITKVYSRGINTQNKGQFRRAGKGETI
jgi:hypothetical protein